MDDARIAGEMTLAGIARRLDSIQLDLVTVKQDVAAIKSDVAGLKTDVAGLMYEVTTGFNRVDSELNAARIRDEKLHALMTFGLEAREVLRDEMGRRFDSMDSKHDEQIGLLKAVVRGR